MDNSSANIQLTSAESASSTTDDTHTEIRLNVQPEVKCHTPFTTTTTVKIILGLISAIVLVALVGALVVVVDVAMNKHQVIERTAELKEKMLSLQDMTHELQTMLNKTELPQPPPATTATTTSAVDTTASDVLDLYNKSSCAAIHTHLPDSASGVYLIYPGGHTPGCLVWCDMETDGGGWTQFQRRHNGSVSFSQPWKVYQKGFGAPQGEFWLGNDDLHRLTTTQPSELRVDLWDVDRKNGHATYSSFSVGNSSTSYRLHVDGYSGTILDSLTDHDSQPFTTTDRVNYAPINNCVNNNGGGGGWWFRACGHSNLNGRYYPGGVRNVEGVLWTNMFSSHYHHHNWYSYTGTAMLTRPRQ